MSTHSFVLDKLILVPANISDLDAIHQLESQSYHPDEAASRKQLQDRLGYSTQSGSELFMKACVDNVLVGFICSTLASSSLVTDESMSAHDPKGKTICLHSICVQPNYRRQGVAAAMLKQWIAGLPLNKYKRIALLSRPRLIPLYESAGFHNLGESNVVHGPEPWYDCIINLDGTSD